MQARRDLLTAMKEMGRPSTAIRPPAETNPLNHDSIDYSSEKNVFLA
jgi:hypothetical protein